jgi:uncharacterized protein YkwD
VSLRLRLIALLVGLVLSPACAHVGKAPTAQLPAPPDALLLPEELEVAKLINQYRALGGLPALEIDPALGRAARKHSTNMARQRRMAHVLDGRGPGDRASKEGFRGSVYENCAAGDRNTPRSFFELWVKSDGHRANLLVLRTGAMGIGFAHSSAGDKDYYTVMFGSPPWLRVEGGTAP